MNLCVVPSQMNAAALVPGLAPAVRSSWLRPCLDFRRGSPALGCALAQVNTFVNGPAYRLASVSYETLRKHATALAGCVDLLVSLGWLRARHAAGGTL